MKYILFSLIFFVLNCNVFAQRIALNEIDKFTDEKIYKVDVSEGKRWKTSDNVAKGLLNNVFISTKIVNTEKRKNVLLNFNLQLGRTLCVNPNDGKVILLFSDNSKITLNQHTEINCQSILNVDYFIGENQSEIESNLLNLTTKSISSFRIYFTDNFADFDVKEDKKELIKNHFKLIQKEFEKI
jgi:hypothetical protein